MRSSGEQQSGGGERADSSWRMWAVRGFVGACAIAVALGAGLVWGRLSAGTAGGPHEASTQPAAGEAVLYWTCSMHPQIKLPKPGQCPICFMDLIPVRAGEGGDSDLPQISLTRRARELARVETSPVEERVLDHEIRMVGKVTPDETRITYVSSYIPGRLDRLFVDYTGILVNKGDHLAEIYSPDLLVAQQEYLISLETLDKASDGAGRQAAGAMLEAARRKLELWGISKDQIEALGRHRRPGDHMQIDAPLTGWVIERQAFEGMYVETGTRLFTLADLRTVWVQLDAYEMDVGSLRLGQEVEFETEAFPGEKFHGRVSYLDPVLNAATRTIKVRVVMANPDMRLRPEMFVRARVKVRLGAGGAVLDSGLAGKWICPMHPEVVKDGPGQCDKCGMDLQRAETLGYVAQPSKDSKALAVPQTAVLLTGTRAVVYVEKMERDRPVYEGRVVELGPRAGEYYIVREGLQPGERVVTRGALMIDSALQIQARPSMMQPAATQTASAPAAGTQPEAPEPVPSRHVAGAMYHQHVAPVIDAYLELITKLAADDAAGASTAIGKLRKALEGAVPHGLQGANADAFKTQIAAVGASLPADKAAIDEVRNRLPAVTKALEEYLQTFGHDRPGPLFQAFCPMALNNQGASWLQASEQINNPYFGRKMLRCGEIRGRIAADGKAAP